MSIYDGISNGLNKQISSLNSCSSQLTQSILSVKTQVIIEAKLIIFYSKMALHFTGL